MLISNAYAQAPVAAGEPNLIMGYLPLIIIFVIFYFLFIRPQNQKMKAHQELIAGLKRGDKVVTDSGIYGEITKVIDDASVEVKIAENVTIKVVRNAVSALVEADKKADKKVEKKSKK